MRQLIDISVSLFGRLGLSLREQFPAAGLVGGLVLFGERNTSIATSHKSRANNPSIRSPASNEIISDSAELWDTDVCFLRIQLARTNVRLPKIHKIPPRFILIDNAKPCYPHSNIVGSHLCDECMKIIFGKRLPQALVHLVTARASLFADHGMSGLPTRAKYKHFKTICARRFLDTHKN